ncbi:hypothetical protein GCM10023353_38200 [Tomitella cavernea]|uniref:Uncharacterized protein n=1 Tax=Tomitella cavernea TaxID=1387982 RepID=A0ABP9D750_9ACTN
MPVALAGVRWERVCTPVVPPSSFLPMKARSACFPLRAADWGSWNKERPEPAEAAVYAAKAPGEPGERDYAAEGFIGKKMSAEGAVLSAPPRGAVDDAAGPARPARRQAGRSPTTAAAPPGPARQAHRGHTATAAWRPARELRKPRKGPAGAHLLFFPAGAVAAICFVRRRVRLRL